MAKFEDLVYVLARTLNTSACVSQYEGWGGDFSKKEIKESFGQLKEWANKEKLDFSKMDNKELRSLGFAKWDADNQYMVPLWALGMLPKGMELTDINGEKAVVGKDPLDNDIRFGCIPYYFTKE